MLKKAWEKWKEAWSEYQDVHNPTRIHLRDAVEQIKELKQENAELIQQLEQLRQREQH